MNNSQTQLILVNKDDKVVGYQEKFDCHKHPVPLHRAISVVILDPSGKKMLLQRRATDKKTWPLFWTNACCTHPMKGESYKKAASRRLKEEMGISTELKNVFNFIYKAKYDGEWGEHELDYVFVGNWEGKVNPNPEEVADYKWVEADSLLKDVKRHPNLYTPWFKIILTKMFPSETTRSKMI